MGYTTNETSTLGDLPPNLVETLKGMNIAPDDCTYGSLPDLDDKFIEVLQGGDHVTHEGLIDMAHKDGLRLTYTEPVQIPPPDKQRDGEPVVFRAVVVTKRGLFCAYGDATPDDTMVKAIIRMAETRALSRALRSAVNVGSATAPEMPDSTDGVQVE